MYVVYKLFNLCSHVLQVTVEDSSGPVSASHSIAYKA